MKKSFKFLVQITFCIFLSSGFIFLGNIFAGMATGPTDAAIDAMDFWGRVCLFSFVALTIEFVLAFLFIGDT